YRGILLSNIARAFVMCGELGRAAAWMRNALPLMKRQGIQWHAFDDIAMVALLRGEASAAARLHGAAEAGFARIGHRRQQVNCVLLADLRRRLNETFAPADFASLMHEGATMSEKDVLGLAESELEAYVS